MNCTLMLQKIYSYHFNDPIRLKIQRECVDDSITIILTLLFIFFVFLSNFCSK